MKHKFICLQFFSFCLLFSSCFILFNEEMLIKAAKKGVTDRNDQFNSSERLFTLPEMDRLKNSTVLFVLREDDLAIRKEYEKAIKFAWKLNNINVVSLKEMRNLPAGDYSFFEIVGYTNSSSESNSYGESILSQSFSHLYLTLKHSVKDGENSDIETDYCRIELFPDNNTLDLVQNNQSNIANSASINDFNDFMYYNGTIKNWKPGFLKLYLSDVSSNLLNSQREFLYESMTEKAEIEKLKNDTLYVPNYLLEKVKKRRGEESTKLLPEKIFADYPHPYKIVDEKRLSGYILNNSVEYILDYVRSNTDQYLRVFSLSKGKIYQKYSPNQLNIVPKDIESILK